MTLLGIAEMPAGCQNKKRRVNKIANQVAPENLWQRSTGSIDTAAGPQEGRMIIKTRVFELGNNGYKNLAELAQVMEISVSQIYRVREGKRPINQKFIVGAIKAFPERRLEDLFYLAPEPLPMPARGGEPSNS